ncbi:MAG TPA: short chain dehydrogenase, partial [Solibacterales bacterium]|nr:short chain dehydrogenase [Bryobacterales bacterium]
MTLQYQVAEAWASLRYYRRRTLITIASLASRNGFAGGTAYVASKHAALGFSRALMMEARKDN